MNVVSKNFSIYLNNVYNYNSILENWNESFKYIYEKIRNGNYISNNFKLINGDSKYPNSFKYIKEYKKYNINKIRESSLLSINDLMEMIKSENIGLKISADKIPNSEDELIFDVNLNRTYHTDLNELYNISDYFFDLLNVREYFNPMFLLIGFPFENNITSSKKIQTSKISYFIPVYIFIVELLNLVTKVRKEIPYNIVDNSSFSINSIYNDFIEFLNLYSIEDIKQNNIISKSELKDDLENNILTNENRNIITDDNIDLNIEEKYILNDKIISKLMDTEENRVITTENKDVITLPSRMNKEVIAQDVSEIIIKNIYNNCFFSKDLKDKISYELIWIIGKLPKYFSNFLIDKNINPSLNISELYTTSLFQVVAIKIMIYILNNFNIIEQDQKDDALSLDRETQIISIFLNRVNSFNLKHYLNISFLYRENPMKFLTVIPLLIKSFVEIDIMPITEKFLTEFDILASIRELDNDNFYNGINSSFEQYLNTELLINSSTEYNVSKFVINLFFIDKMDQFIESKYFVDFVNNILVTIFNYLNRNGFIDKTYNWYGAIDGLKLYFKSLIRTYLTNGELFKKLTSDLEFEVINILEQIDINFDKNLIVSNFRGFYNNNKNIQNVYNLIMNIYLGTVSKQISYDVLKYFLI